MTELYDWYPIPHRLDISCPNCGQLASFEFAESAIIQKQDLGFFRKNPNFHVGRYQDSCGHYRTKASYFHGLKGIEPSWRDLPPRYSRNSWEHSRYLQIRRSGALGAVVCPSCFIRKKASLAWPDMAYFKVEWKGQILWAFHRESAMELHDYLASHDRDAKSYRWAYFLLHIPGRFLAAKARDELCRRLFRTLSA